MDHLLRLRRSCCHFRDPLSWSLAHQHLAGEPWPANPPRSRRQSQLHHRLWIAATRRRCSSRCALKTCCRAAAICSSSASSFSSSLTCQSCLARACAHAGACAIREAKSRIGGWGQCRVRVDGEGCACASAPTLMRSMQRAAVPPRQQPLHLLRDRWAAAGVALQLTPLPTASGHPQWLR